MKKISAWLLIFSSLFLFSCTPKTMSDPSTDTLQIEILEPGDGQEAKPGDTVSVHYTGTLTDGTVFDSSVKRGVPFAFNLGAGQVIRGWDEGVAGMKIDETRKLTIPPDMAYGDQAVGPIPAGSTLIFEVKLEGIE